MRKQPKQSITIAQSTRLARASKYKKVKKKNKINKTTQGGEPAHDSHLCECRSCALHRNEPLDACYWPSWPNLDRLEGPKGENSGRQRRTQGQPGCRSQRRLTGSEGWRTALPATTSDNGNATGQPAAARSTARGHTARVGRQVRISDDAVGDAGPSRAARRRTRRIPGVFLAKQQQCFGA